MSLSIAASHNARNSSGSDEVRLTPHERVTAQISSLLERGVRPWIKPWDDIAPSDALVMPLRSCGTPYRDGVDAPQTAKPARMRKAQSQLREVQMTEVVVVGLDIAKH
ncbi:MAG: ArdC family protein, partial [Aquidulcibacter sp.]|nr:ArdC family protein [Aquidulcibacter sp.]